MNETPFDITQDDVEGSLTPEAKLLTPVEFAKYDASIGVYSVDEFSGLLKSPTTTNLKYSDMVDYKGAVLDNEGVLSSKENNPAVLVEANASFCSILLTIDSYGNAVMLHSPLTPPSDIESLEFSPESDGNIVEYARALKKVVKGNENMTIVAGHTMSTMRNADLVVQALKNYLSISYSNIKRMTEPTDLEMLDIDMASGVIFIPKYLSKSGRNIILMIDYGFNISELRSVLNQKNNK